jgi:alcohol dehydrogenase
MKAAIVNPMGLENLAIREVPEPKPGPNEVVVRLRAASLNFRDLLAVAGGYGSTQKQENLIPLSDGAGEVVEVGPAVRDWKSGDRVINCFFPDWQTGPARAGNFATDLGGRCDGVACEYRVFRENALVRMPADLSFVEAATLPCAAATAWHAIIEIGQIGPGQALLTQGTGGVSLFAVQFGVIAGAKVYATTSSEAKAERLHALGAAHVIDYVKDPDWGKSVQKETRGRGVEHVVEIGGADTFRQSLRAVAVGGTISVIGVVSGPRAELNIPVVIMQNVRIQGISAGSRSELVRMAEAVAQHHVKPVVDKVFPLAELRQALEYLKARKHVGKVCIEI